MRVCDICRKREADRQRVLPLEIVDHTTTPTEIKVDFCRECEHEFLTRLDHLLNTIMQEKRGEI